MKTDERPGWVKSVIKKYGNAMKRIGVTDDKPLGCGYYGCVFKTDDPKWVLKITRDPTEGPIVQHIMKYRMEEEGGDGRGPYGTLDGVVFYKDIYQAESIQWRGKEWPVYFIIREAIEPINWNLYHTTYNAPSLNNIPAQYVRRSLNALRHAKMYAMEFFTLKSKYRKELAKEKYFESLSDIMDAFPEVADVLYTLYDEDMIFQDVHMHNLGQSIIDWKDFRRPGTIVIHDLGHTPSQPLAPFEILKNPWKGLDA
jgi:hypothetical protein